MTCKQYLTKTNDRCDHYMFNRDKAEAGHHVFAGGENCEFNDHGECKAIKEQDIFKNWTNTELFD